MTTLGALYKEKENRGIKFNTELINIILPSRDTDFPFQDDSLFPNFERIGTHEERLQGLHTIIILRKLKGERLIAQAKKSKTVFKKSR